MRLPQPCQPPVFDSGTEAISGPPVLPSEQDPPGQEAIRGALRVREVRPVLVPRDCADGFGAAFWARPEAYLDPEIQAGMSWPALLTPQARQRGADQL